jgi:DNA-binding XRE family transcriptional regulator
LEGSWFVDLAMPAKSPPPKASNASAQRRKSLYRPENAALLASFRELRVAAKLSQQDFADRLGSNQSFVSAVEQGVVRLDAVQIRDWCAAAGASMQAWLKVFEALLEAREALRDDHAARGQDKT